MHEFESPTGRFELYLVVDLYPVVDELQFLPMGEVADYGDAVGAAEAYADDIALFGLGRDGL